MLFIMMMLLAFGSGSHTDVKIRLFFFFFFGPSRLLFKLGLNNWIVRITQRRDLLAC